MRFPQPMDDLIQVRVTRDEKRRLSATARRGGITLSDLLREGGSLMARFISDAEQSVSRSRQARGS